MKRPVRENPQIAVQKWNEQHSVGTLVFVLRDSGATETTRTRSKAEVLSGHTAVIWLEGISGCYLLDRVRPVPAQ